MANGPRAHERLAALKLPLNTAGQHIGVTATFWGVKWSQVQILSARPRNAG